MGVWFLRHDILHPELPCIDNSVEPECLCLLTPVGIVQSTFQGKRTRLFMPPHGIPFRPCPEGKYRTCVSGTVHGLAHAPVPVMLPVDTVCTVSFEAVTDVSACPGVIRSCCPVCCSLFKAGVAEQVGRIAHFPFLQLYPGDICCPGGIIQACGYSIKAFPYCQFEGKTHPAVAVLYGRVRGSGEHVRVQIPAGGHDLQAGTEAFRRNIFRLYVCR